MGRGPVTGVLVTIVGVIALLFVVWVIGVTITKNSKWFMGRATSNLIPYTGPYGEGLTWEEWYKQNGQNWVRHDYGFEYGKHDDIYEKWAAWGGSGQTDIDAGLVNPSGYYPYACDRQRCGPSGPGGKMNQESGYFPLGCSSDPYGFSLHAPIWSDTKTCWGFDQPEAYGLSDDKLRSEWERAAGPPSVSDDQDDFDAYFDDFLKWRNSVNAAVQVGQTPPTALSYLNATYGVPVSNGPPPSNGPPSDVPAPDATSDYIPTLNHHEARDYSDSGGGGGGGGTYQSLPYIYFNRGDYASMDAEKAEYVPTSNHHPFDKSKEYQLSMTANRLNTSSYIPTLNHFPTKEPSRKIDEFTPYSELTQDFVLPISSLNAHQVGPINEYSRKSYMRPTEGKELTMETGN